MVCLTEGRPQGAHRALSAIHKVYGLWPWCALQKEGLRSHIGPNLPYIRPMDYSCLTEGRWLHVRLNVPYPHWGTRSVSWRKCKAQAYVRSEIFVFRMPNIYQLQVPAYMIHLASKAVERFPR
eukprot:546051-Pelagomonas_calceolata.AAC.2